MRFQRAELEGLDFRGYVAIDALTYGGRQSVSTLAGPCTFVCSDKKTYWLKGKAQYGLSAELIAGRLAAAVGVGPIARIIRVVPEASTPEASSVNVEGTIVGTEDVPDTMNSKDLSSFMPQGQLPSGAIDQRSRARVAVFQTWVGMNTDPQVLVGLTDGKIYSIDHGGCFGSTGDTADPRVVEASIPGVADDLKDASAHILRAVARVEAVSDRELLRAVAKMPAGQIWNSAIDRRLEIAEWLARRRDRLREVMKAWLQT